MKNDFKSKKSKEKKRKFSGLQSIDDSVSKILKPIFNGNKKEFLVINNLARNWEKIIGKKYHKFCYPKIVTFPKKNSKAKLTIAVFNPAIGFFLENNSEIILERIATFYGFKSIERIIIKQEPKDLELDEKEEIKLPKKKENLLDKIVSKIEDEGLAETLRRLGKEVMNKEDKNS